MMAQAFAELAKKVNHYEPLLKGFTIFGTQCF